MPNLKRRGLHDSSPSSSSPNRAQTASPKSPRRGKKSNKLYPQLDNSASDVSEISDGSSSANLYPDLHQEQHELEDDDRLTEEDLTDSENIGDAPDGRNQSARRRRQPRTRAAKRRVDNPPYDVSEEEIGPDDTEKGESNPIAMIAIVLVIVAVVVALMLSQSPGTIFRNTAPTTTSTPPPVKEFYMKFKFGLHDIKQQYLSQTHRFWQVIGTSIKRVLTESEPTYPAIILLGVPKGQSLTAACFAKSLISKINSIYNSTSDFYVNSTDLNQVSPAKTKLDLDNRLKSILSDGKGVVLDHIETLPADAALLLHAYCDGDNAPFKASVIVLVLNTDLGQSEINDKAVEKELTTLWAAELGVDEMPALRSRIANNIAVLKDEQSVACD